MITTPYAVYEALSRRPTRTRNTVELDILLIEDVLTDGAVTPYQRMRMKALASWIGKKAEGVL
jgi:hypothetical protein